VPEYDAIVIGAGHNGLTAAAFLARGGMRVLCLEKNHFIGGMSSTTELVRGYRFELAGSIQFPIPNEIFDDLGFVSCPIPAGGPHCSRRTCPRWKRDLNVSEVPAPYDGGGRPGAAGPGP